MKELQSNMKPFVNAISRRYGVKVVDKTSPEYALVHSAVISMGIDAADEWLDQWSITLPGLIWLSFVPGKGTKLELIQQIITICHEFIHVGQWREDKAKFAARYVFRESDRAHYEAEAMHANVEMAYALGRKPNTDEMAKILKAYKVSDADIRVTQKHLKIYDTVARTGARSEEVTKWACKWWGIA